MKSAVIQLREGVHWVGVKDWSRRMFDGLIPLPHGTSYNAYLVQGKTKTALVDTVNPGFEGDLLAKVGAVMDPAKLDYLIMNHAEPDHAGAIPAVLAQRPQAQLVLTEKGADMAVRYYRVSRDRMQVVKDGDTLDGRRRCSPTSSRTKFSSRATSSAPTPQPGCTMTNWPTFPCAPRCTSARS